MNIATRTALLLVGIVFTAYHAARTLFWTGPVVHPVLIIITVCIVALVTLIGLFAESRNPVVSSDVALTAGGNGPGVLPMWAGVLGMVTAALTPTAVAIGVGREHVDAPYATGYIGGVGLLLTVVMIRRRVMCAWIGVGLLVIGSVAWLGPLGAFSFGLVGAIMWVSVAQIIMHSLDRASRDTMRLLELQRAAAAWQAAQSVRRRERRVRVQFALQVAGPLLTRMIGQEGALTDEERAEARVAEGSLRDELRAPHLLDTRVRIAIERARRQGGTVTLLDEGGLDGLHDDELGRIRGEIADAISDAQSARIIVRSSRHAEIAVTVVGRSAAGDGLAADDTVELWQEIARTTSV